MYRHISREEDARLFLHQLMTLHNTELQRVDRCSMAYEVEVRVPFLDLDVVDLALHMPREWKINNGVEKWAVREAFKDELPDYVVKREKNPLSYSSGLHEWVRMYKILFARYYNQCGFNLHAPIKMDFSHILTRNGYNLKMAVAEDRLAKDYPKSELVKEAFKAGVRTFILRTR
jgi:asparagine synthase (glutamine-hydrolysing)